ncbi:MAG: TIGR04283 family arsenosugar biosynthesis glycosyltransferase [Nonlabens sp.]
MLISIIIPVLNEEATIGRLLSYLNYGAADPTKFEIVVVDGGSQDSTLAKVETFCSSVPKVKCSIVSSEKGRAKQLDAGAQAAAGQILYFLHVDSFPPAKFDDAIREAILKGHPAGCFRMKFDTKHPWLKMIGWWTRFSWKASRGGDQSQYITADLYNDIGGYDTSLPIYEDYDIINKLYERDQYHVIPEWLTTSDRRYQEVGVMRLQWYYLQIYYKKYRGATIEEIQAFYKSKCN